MKTHAFIRKMLGFSIAPVFSALLSLFVVPVVSHLFPADEFGKIDLFYSTGNMLMSLFLLGLDSAYIRYYFSPPALLSEKTMQALVLLIGLLVDAFATVIASVMFGKTISLGLFGEECPEAIVLLGLFTASLIVFRLVNTTARMQENSVQYSVQCILQTSATKLSYVAMSFFTTRYLYSIGLMTISMVIVSVTFLFLQRHSFSWPMVRPLSSQLKPLFKFGIPSLASSLVSNLNSVMGKYILSFGGLISGVGILSIATTLSNVFIIIPNAFSLYWSPFMYKNYESKQDFIIRIHDYIVLLAFALICLIFLFQDLIFLIVGSNYRSAQAFFMLVMMAPVQALLSETTSYGITIEQRPIYLTICSLISMSLGALATLFSMPQFGVISAGIGVATSSTLMFLSTTLIGQHFYKSVSNLFRSVFSFALMLFIAFSNCVVYESLTCRLLIFAFVSVLVIAMFHREMADVGRYLCARGKGLG